MLSVNLRQPARANKRSNSFPSDARQENQVPFLQSASILARTSGKTEISLLS